MTKNKISEILLSGESSTIEFKSENVRTDSLAGEIVSFANFMGGTLFIGVEDDGSVTGVKRKDMEEFIINVCRNNINPSIIPSIEKFIIKDKLIFAVNIPEGDTLYSTSSGKYYIRVGSTKQQPSQLELIRLFQKRNLIQFDETPVLTASINSIDLKKVNHYLLQLGQSALDEENYGIENELLNLSILTHNEVSKITSSTCPTLAGMLVFGKNPQKYFPSYMISCGAYLGNDLLSNVIREDDIAGTIDDQIEKTISFLKLTMAQKTLMKDEIKQEKHFLYPVEVLREAIVNAVCHRDYTIAGSAIRVLLFKDRLEIRSPGELPNTLTLKSMIYRQFTRNQAIASFLAPMGYMEKRGKGIIKIMKLCQKNNIKSHFYITEDKSEFVVELQKLHST